MSWAKNRGVGKTSVFSMAGAPQGGAAARMEAWGALWVWRGGGV
ncbi:hypothetical protein ODS41_10325 [Pyrobaculum sp. 3827-6]|nr:hypothetical protein [Pyrobaculum sp. 3827-6]MCU7788305.1 hypothetical protein [Pyrobaculum sp. 3827-6]